MIDRTCSSNLGTFWLIDQFITIRGFILEDTPSNPKKDLDPDRHLPFLSMVVTLSGLYIFFNLLKGMI